MPTHLTLESEYLRIERGASSLGELDKHRIWHDVTTTPAHTYHQLFAIPSHGPALTLRARNAFTIDVARAFLAFFLTNRPAVLPNTLLTVVHGVRVHPYSFDTLVFVPPSIASLYAHQSEFLNAGTAWLIPAHTSEFRSGHTAAVFWFAVREGGLEPLDWARNAVPIVHAQLLSAWPGGPLRFRKAPFLLRYSSLSYILPALPVSVSGLRLVSAWGTEVLVRRDLSGSFTVSASRSAGGATQSKATEATVVPLVQDILSTDAHPEESGA